MKLVFLGTPEWAVPSLEALAASGHEVAAVVTAPDAPVGRSRRPVPPPVKRAAERLGLVPVLQPPTLRSAAARAAILAPSPDALAVVAYGKILPGRLLDAPPHGAVNLHFSLLPRHRGASPVQHALLAGDERTGVSTMLVDRGLDTGPVLLQQAVDIESWEAAPELGERLAIRGARLLVETFDGLEAGRLRPRPQDDAAATLAPSLAREMGHVDWSVSAVEIERMVRAFAGWPPVVCEGSKGRLRLRRARAVDGSSGASPAPPGTVLGRSGDGLDVACGGGTVLRIDQLQPAGGRAMSGAAALAGRYVEPGGRLRAPSE